MKEVNVKLMPRLDDIHELQAQLREQVIRDPLTQMYNRRYLDDALPGEIARALGRNRVVTYDAGGQDAARTRAG